MCVVVRTYYEPSGTVGAASFFLLMVPTSTQVHQVTSTLGRVVK